MGRQEKKKRYGEHDDGVSVIVLRVYYGEEGRKEAERETLDSHIVASGQDTHSTV